MNKEYKIKLDLNKKLYNKKMAFNQFDENVNDFYIEVTKNNEVVKDLDKSIITLVAIKPNNAVDAQFIEVKEGQIYADLKPSMCDLVGNYQAKAMIVLEGEIVTTDIINYSVNEDKIISRLNEDVVSDERFALFTDALARLSDIEASEEQRIVNEAERILSEENRKIEEAERVEAELIRQHEEADRAKYDAIRESNENIRKQNESIRLANETNRIDEEAKRVEQENKRKLAEEERNANYNFMTEDEDRRRSEANAHKEAEKLRAQAENTRVNEEAKRRTTEQARVSAENTRVSNENTRKASEVTRQTNETQRVEAETQRQNRYNSFIADAEANANNFENYTNAAKVNEGERKSNELDRKSQEDRRVSNEVERISNENTRKANEVAREKNETSRQYVFENKVNEVDKKIVELNTTKDNFVSNINTKVDTKISEIDNVKDNFVSSVNTKVDSKISELDTAKSDMTNTVSNKVNEVENRFNALTSKQQQDAEVIDARDEETSLKARLDRDIEKAKQVYVNVEGSHISTDSSVGYLKDIEILGNTIQSASNLADIRSVGDKVEGQELYEIPVLSVGKNLFDGNKFTPREAINQYSYIDGILTMRCDGQAYRRVDYILPNTLVHGKRYILTANVKALEYSSGYTPGQNFGYGYYNGGSADYYGSFDASSNTTKLEFVYNEQGENVIGFHNEVKEGLTKLQWSNIQIEEGTVATQYEPYQEDKLTILSPAQLEKVGDVRDRIICKDGVWGVEKNIYTATVDSFYQHSNKQLWYIHKDKAPSWKSKNVWNEISNRVMCNYYKEVATYNEVSVTEGIFIDHKGATPNIIIGTNDANVNSLPSDLIVKYQLETPQFIPLQHDQQVKLRTFANKTNISFGCEIEGTIKAQVPKSLGATVNTHTEQIRSLNNELNRVKKLEESTVSTVTTESDFTTVEATSNGYFEDVKLEGKTLVNCLNVEPNVYTTSLHKSEIVNGYHKLTMLADGDLMWDLAKTNDLNLFKPSTYYTFIVDVKTNTTQSTEPIRANTSLNCIFTNGGNSNSYIKLSELNQSGVFIYKYKSEPNFTSNNVKLKMANAKSGGVLEYRMVILEGDHTQNPPSGYIEGLKSVGDGVDEIVVSSVKGDGNLFDTDINFDYGNLLLNNKDTARIHTASRIKVCKNTDYYIKSPSGYLTVVSAVNENNVSIKDLNTGYTEAFVFNTQEYDYIGIQLKRTDNGTIDLPNFDNSLIMFNKGATPKPYTPHQSDKKRLLYYNTETQTWEKPILREWDSIEKHANGKYYYHKRSGELVLNGSENWGLNTVGNDTSRFYLNFPSIKPTGNTLSTSNLVIDKLMEISYSVISTKDIEGISVHGTGNQINLRLSNTKLQTQDVQGLKQWLQANNVTVVYQLAQEKVYECTNIDLITYANETNYIVESGAIVPRTTLKVHNNISNVVSLLQKKVSLLESNVKASQEVQDMMILETDMRMLDIELALIDFMPMKLNLGGSDMLRSATYFNFLKNHIINETYEKEYLENVMNKYLATGRINQDEYDELYKMLYPPVYDIELPIEY